MKKSFLKALAVVLCIIMTAGIFAGCTPKKDTAGKEDAPKAADTSAQNAKPYPVKGNPTLKVWFANPTSKLVKTNAETAWAKEQEKATGVKIEWLHSSSNDQFNLMLASRDLPDIIYYNWFSFRGGPEKAINDEIIIPLNDVLDKYAPNLKKYLKEAPDVDKRIKTDSGKYSCFPASRGSKDATIYYGPMVRKDWLDDLSLKVPETIDDWYVMLKAFKEKKGSTAPLSLDTKGIPPRNAAFIGAYNIFFGMYQMDGKIKYGPAEPAYKDFIATFSKWYKEGLLDPDIATVDGKVLDAKMTSDKTGATVGLAGGQLGTWISAMKAKNPRFDLVGVPFPSLKKGEPCKMGNVASILQGSNGSITTACKNVEAAARWLDWPYSPEGHMVYNFGIEGDTYTMVNGVPTYTDKIMKAPEGAGSVLGNFCNVNANVVQDINYFKQFTLGMPQQQAAQKAWVSDAEKYQLPELTPTLQESDEIATIMNDINNYTNETYMKLLLGAEPIDRIDAHVAQLKKLGLDRAMQLYQAQLDRFNARK